MSGFLATTQLFDAFGSFGLPGSMLPWLEILVACIYSAAAVAKVWYYVW